MGLASSRSVLEKFQPDSIATYVALLHNPNGGVVYRVENPAALPASELYQLREKLLAADEGKDIYLYGRVKGNVFTATDILEVGTALSDDDFEMFCLSLDIPYVISK